MKKILIYILVLSTLVVSCDTIPDYEIETSSTYPVSGEWWVTYEFDNGSDTVDDHLHLGHVHLLTYNTSNSGADSLWVNDNGDFWDFRVKVGLNMSSYSFSADSAINHSYESKVSIANGKVIPRQDGDSIYFEAYFNDDTDKFKYIVSGRRIKGFTDDLKNTSYELDYP